MPALLYEKIEHSELRQVVTRCTGSCKDDRHHQQGWSPSAQPGSYFCDEQQGYHRSSSLSQVHVLSLRFNLLYSEQRA